jgi:pyruvate, water dikinase
MTAAGLTPLAEAHARELFGGKAVGLARLLVAGLPVPPGYAVDPERLRALTTNAREAWAHASTLGSSFALRSSAIDEDSKAASFAGQHASVLGIASEAALAEAAARVVESGAASRSYREALGLGGPNVLAAVLQLLVEPVVSGVLFSRHPVSGEDNLVVEAAWGLGEVVVQGLVEPDHIVVSRDGRVLEERVGHKDVRIGLAGEEAVPEPDRDVPCLRRDVLADLVAHVQACEAVAGGPADVEWAWDGARVWLLQCRAITTL